MKQVRLFLIGYLGANNLGDECMLRQFLSLFAPYSNVSFVIESHGIDYTADGITTNFISNNPTLRRGINDELLKDVDAVVWVGGNCFTDYDGEGAVRLVLKAKLMGKRFYYVGVGMDKLALIKRKLRAFVALQLADAVIFRDFFSLIYAKKWFVGNRKLAIAPDLGELYIRQHLAEYPLEDSIIAVSWRELKKNICFQDELLSNLEAFLVSLSIKYNQQLVIFNTDEFCDKYVHSKLVELLTTHGFSNFIYHENTTLEQKLSIISKAGCVITARLHTAVAADVFDKACFVYNYSQKIVEFAQDKENVRVLSENLAGVPIDDSVMRYKKPDVENNINDEVYRNFVSKYLV